MANMNSVYAYFPWPDETIKYNPSGSSKMVILMVISHTIFFHIKNGRIRLNFLFIE